MIRSFVEGCMGVLHVSAVLTDLSGWVKDFSLCSTQPCDDFPFPIGRAALPPLFQFHDHGAVAMLTVLARDKAVKP